MKRNTFLLLLFILAIGMVLYYTFHSPLWISASEARQAIKDGKFPIILDVRTDLEYNLGHYPNAVHIPTSQIAGSSLGDREIPRPGISTALLKEQLELKLPNKDQGILVYCNTGQRARQAADLLKSQGYKEVRYISGPYWSLSR